MEFLKYKRIFNSILLTSALISAGCSDVSFAPGPDQNTDLSIPGGSDGSNGSNNGETPGTVTNKMDQFVQVVDNPATDILIVVDNSGSMREEQQKMGDRVDSFLGKLSDIDWRLAITTTDVSNGSYGLQGSFLPFTTGVNVLSKSVANYNSLFLNTITRPETLSCTPSTCPVSGDEQPLFASILAMQKYSETEINFFRSNADLALMYLSDEDEMSDAPSNATRASEVIATAQSIWGNQKKITAYGIIIQPGDSACLNAQGETGGHYGTRVTELAQLTKGIIGSICAPDYSEILATMGQKVREVSSSYALSAEPVAGSVSVQLNPQQVGVTWRVNGSQLIFDKIPAAGTVITVKYKTAE